MKKRFAIRVYGKVQNVGFRFYTARIARELDIAGYVKNEMDGTVFIKAEGEETTIDEFIGWCRKGPDWARVDRLDISEEPLTGHTGFKIS